MRIEVSRSKCSGHGLCVLQGGSVYTLDDDGYNDTPDQEVPAALGEAASLGAESCPERAIKVSR